MNQLNWHQFFLLERPMQRRLQWQINKSTNQQINKGTNEQTIEQTRRRIPNLTTPRKTNQNSIRGKASNETRSRRRLQQQKTNFVIHRYANEHRKYPMTFRIEMSPLDADPFSFVSLRSSPSSHLQSFQWRHSNFIHSQPDAQPVSPLHLINSWWIFKLSHDGADLVPASRLPTAPNFSAAIS